MTTAAKVTVTTPNEREIVMTTMFDAPRDLVYDCYTKAELLEYLRHCREKSRTTIGMLTDLEAVRVIEFRWLRMKVGELLLYSMRHVQHHTGQLNIVLRQEGLEPPDWSRRATPEEANSNG